MRSKSSELMNKILDCIEQEYKRTGLNPTMTEIASKLNVSQACISKYVAEMRNRGMLDHEFGKRSIITNSMKKIVNDVEYLPVVGTIACGTPILAEENIESKIPIPKGLLGSGNHFILRASGESMINAGINDGDYVIVRQQDTAEQGQIVVALIDDEATLKRYYIDQEKKQYRLHPENNKMKDMYFDNIVIQGVAVKIIKDLC